jgi:DNA-binding transcriptional LysR family regulator
MPLSPLPAVEIRHLRTFLTIVEGANFTRAAERLGLSQPSVSQQVKELETALGFALFHRHGVVVELTKAGEQFRERALVAVRRFQEAMSLTESGTGGLSGHLNVGVISVLTLAWTPRLLGRIAAESPGLTIRLREEPAHRIESALEAGHLDVGLVLLSRASPALHYEVLRTDRLVLVAPAGDPRWPDGAVGLDEVAAEPLAMLPEGFPMRQFVDDLFRDRGLRLRVRFEIDRVEALLSAVALSGTPSVLPSVVLERPAGSTPLRAVSLTGADVPVELGLVWSRRRAEEAATQRFLDVARSVLRA